MGFIIFIDKFLVLFPLLLTSTSSTPGKETMRWTRIDRFFIICLLFHLDVCTAVTDEKVCEGVVILDSSNIDSFKDCTKIDGSLIIRTETFTGGKSTPKMDPSELEVFSTVREITGSLYVTASHPDFTDLHYLRNLQIIGQMKDQSGVYIVGTSLKSLGLRCLNRMGYRVTIVSNNNLCFTEGINWRKLLINFYVWRGITWHESLFKPYIELENNRHKDACRAENMVCHEKCSEEDGCWGPGVDECLSCKGFSLEGTCLESCSYPGIYQSGNHKCARCHDECDGICSGPGPGNCMKCPSMTYQMNSDCIQCNEKCIGGCTGPGDFFGSGGCDKVMVRNNNLNQDDAQAGYLKTDEPCEEGYFSELVNVTEITKSLKSMSICRRCHPSCKNCTGYGSHLSVCNKCARFRSEEQCEDQCPDEYYADNTTMRCIRCSPECKGCRGPGPDQCESCRNVKVPLGDKFYCSDTCPEDKPYTLKGLGIPYCFDLQNWIKIKPAIVGGVVACMFLIGVIAATYRYRRWQRTRLRGNTVRMTIEIAGQKDSWKTAQDSAPRPKASNVEQNFEQRSIFKDDELSRSNILKYGALEVDKADGTMGNLKESHCTSPFYQHESIVSKDLTVDSQQGNSGGGPESPFIAAKFPILQLDQTDTMWFISQYLDNENWIRVGRNLKIDNERLNELKSKQDMNNRDRAFQMLLIWRESNPRCTLEDLFDALRELGLQSTIIQIKQINFSEYMTQVRDIRYWTL